MALGRKSKYPNHFTKMQILCYAVQNYRGFYERDLRIWLRKNLGISDEKTIKNHLAQLKKQNLLQKEEEKGYENQWFIPSLETLGKIIREYPQEYDTSKLPLPEGSEACSKTIDAVLPPPEELKRTEVFDDIYDHIDFVQPGFIAEIMHASPNFTKFLIENIDNMERELENIGRALANENRRLSFKFFEKEERDIEVGLCLKNIYGPTHYDLFGELIFNLYFVEYINSFHDLKEGYKTKTIAILDMNERVKRRDWILRTINELFKLNDDLTIEKSLKEEFTKIIRTNYINKIRNLRNNHKANSLEDLYNILQKEMKIMDETINKMNKALENYKVVKKIK